MGSQAHKRIQAGLNMLNGDSQAKALVKAGYSPATARKPKANGLAADRCIGEAIKAHPQIAPAKLVESARKAMHMKLEHICNSPDYVYELKPSEISRIFEVVERFHGAGVDPEDTLRDLTERMAAVSELVEQHNRLKAAIGEATGEGSQLEADCNSQLAEPPSKKGGNSS